MSEEIMRCEAKVKPSLELPEIRFIFKVEIDSDEDFDEALVRFYEEHSMTEKEARAFEKEIAAHAANDIVRQLTETLGVPKNVG